MLLCRKLGYWLLLLSVVIAYSNVIYFPLSEFSGDVDSLELGDMVEYSLSKGKGNKVSAEKVNKTHSGNELWLLLIQPVLWVGNEGYINGSPTVIPKSRSISWPLVRNTGSLTPPQASRNSGWAARFNKSFR